MSTSKPTLDIGVFGRHAATPSLASAVERVSTRLHELGAWPSHDFAPYELKLTSGNAIHTLWGAFPSSRAGRTMEINPQNPLRIEIGIDLFKNGIGSVLVAATQLPRETVLFHLLAHETFHITELDRMSQCGVPIGQHKNGFATGLRPDFNEKWLAAGLKLSENFPLVRVQKNDKEMPPQRLFELACWRASDIATEACADMLALNLMIRAGEPYAAGFNTYVPALIAMRLADQNNALAAGPSFSPDYQIGIALADLIGQGQLSDGQIISETWKIAFCEALLAPELWLDSRALIKPIPPLTRIATRKPKL